MPETRSDGISVRRATRLDLGVLQEFEQGVIAAERPFDPTIKKGEVRYYDIAALIDNDDAFMAIAESDGAPVACGFARKTPSRSFVDPPEHAYVGLIFVAPPFRGRGVTGAILRTLSEWAKAKGLSEMRLEVYPENAAALRAYEKQGFAPHSLEMRASLNR